MVALTATPAGGLLEDTARRDKLTGGIGADVFSISRDGKTDSVYGFADGIDKIDLSKFSVTWSEVQVKFKGGGEFMVTIRGEKTRIVFEPLDNGTEITQDFLMADDFIFAEGPIDPVRNIVLDAPGPTKLVGSDQSDTFVMFEDNVRDVIKKFDPLKDKIDLSGFGISYQDLVFNDVKAGKIVIKLGTEGLVIRDISGTMTSADFTEDMFVFI